jgi:sec-independent protein translocase protein TatA
MGSMSPIHWLIVLLVVLLVFGPKRLASLGKGMGEGIRSFREGISGDADRQAQDDKTIQKEKPQDQTTPQS